MSLSGEGAVAGASAGAAGGSAFGPIGAGIGAVVGGIAGLFSGGGSESSGYTLPPEYELQYLGYFDNAMTQIGQMQQQNQSLLDLYNSRLDSAVAYMNGSLPEAGLIKQLAGTSQNIAQLFGNDAEAMAKAGFMDDYTKSFMTQQQAIADRMAAAESTDYTNPVLEGQLQDQKRQLEQDLARSGVSPAQRAIALQQFERSSQEQRFTNTEQMRTGVTQRGMAQLGGIAGMQSSYLQGKSGLQGMAMSGYNTAMNQLGYAQNTMAGIAGLQGQQYQAGLGGLSMQASLQQLGLQNYQNMGQYKFSYSTDSAIKSGVVGPGSYYAQTGFSRGKGLGSMNSYGGWRNDIERKMASGQLAANQNMTPGGYAAAKQQSQPWSYPQGNQFQNPNA